MAPAGQPSLGSRSVGRSARRLRSRGWRSISDVGDAMARCMRCARASSRRTSSSSRSGSRALDEVEQLGVGVGGVGSVPEHPARSSRSAASSAAPISSTRLRWLATRPERDALVVVVDRRRRRVAQAGDEVPERGRVAAGARLGDRRPGRARSRGSRRCISNAHRAPFTYHARYDNQSVPGSGCGERRTGREHRDRVVEHGVVLDDVVVDRDAGDLLVPRRRVGELADVLDRVADPQRGEIHHRVADVRVLEVEQPGDAALVEHELERVVGDEPRLGVPVLRHVVAQPPPQEHRHRVGGQPLHQGVVERLHPAPVAAERRSPRSRRAARSRRTRPRRAGSRRCARAARGTRRAAARARRRRQRTRGRRARAAGPSRARTDRRRARTRAGRAAPCASSRSWVATSSAIRYGITILGSRSPRAWSGEQRARRPRRRRPTPGASAPAGSTPTTRPPHRALDPRREPRLLVAHRLHGRSHRRSGCITTKYLEY